MRGPLHTFSQSSSPAAASAHSLQTLPALLCERQTPQTVVCGKQREDGGEEKCEWKGRREGCPRIRRRFRPEGGLVGVQVVLYMSLESRLNKCQRQACVAAASMVIACPPQLPPKLEWRVVIRISHPSATSVLSSASREHLAACHHFPNP